MRWILLTVLLAAPMLGHALLVSPSAQKYVAAAKHGDVRAQFKLGLMYAEGDGVEQNHVESAYWLQMAADKGLVEAQRYLAANQVSPSAQKYITAAKQGDERAQLKLGLMYAEGDGVEQNSKKSAYWLQMAADKGLAEAQRYLAEAYAFGQGVERSMAKYTYWLRKAAEQGDLYSQYWLALRYYSAQDASKDLPQAFNLFKKGAEQGHMGSQLHLGLAYAYGEGVEKNVALGRFWMKKAEAQGSKEATYLISELKE